MTWQPFTNAFYVTYAKDTWTSDQQNPFDISVRFSAAFSDDSSSAASNNATQSRFLCKLAHPNWQQLSLTSNEPIQLYI